MNATFYVLRDDIPVGKLTTGREWNDYVAVGTHKYKIRGVDQFDNFVDSNEITLTILIDHATLALAENSSRYLEIKVRRNEKPEKAKTYSVVSDGTYYEGRAYQVYSVGKHRELQQSITFSTCTKNEYDTLLSFIEQGKPLVYRDLYDTQIIGLILNYSSNFRGRFKNQDINYVVDFSTVINAIDYNEVVEYD